MDFDVHSALQSASKVRVCALQQLQAGAVSQSQSGGIFCSDSAEVLPLLVGDVLFVGFVSCAVLNNTKCTWKCKCKCKYEVHILVMAITIELKLQLIYTLNYRMRYKMKSSHLPFILSILIITHSTAATNQDRKTTSKFTDKHVTIYFT